MSFSYIEAKGTFLRPIGAGVPKRKSLILFDDQRKEVVDDQSFPWCSLVHINEKIPNTKSNKTGLYCFNALTISSLNGANNEIAIKHIYNQNFYKK